MSTKKYKTILLLGGGTEQLPAILEAKKFGYNVVCVDKDKNCIGRKYSDFFYKISIKKTKKIEGIFKRHKIKGITSICSDIAVPVVSYLSNKYKLASLYINKLQCQLGINGISYSKTFLRAYLIDWCKNIMNSYKETAYTPATKPFQNIEINDFTETWRNGLAFCAIIYHFRAKLM